MISFQSIFFLYVAVTSTHGHLDQCLQISQYVLMPLSHLLGGVMLHFMTGVGIFFHKKNKNKNKQKKKKRTKKALSVFFSFVFFLYDVWVRTWGRGVGRAVVLLFSCDANSEKVLYCCVQTWPPPVGSMKWVFTGHKT